MKRTSGPVVIVEFELHLDFEIERTITTFNFVRMESDQEIAIRMRCENYEQFQTLVRMHLSFELDLNTDSVE